MNDNQLSHWIYSDKIICRVPLFDYYKICMEHYSSFKATSSFEYDYDYLGKIKYKAKCAIEHGFTNIGCIYHENYENSYSCNPSSDFNTIIFREKSAPELIISMDSYLINSGYVLLSKEQTNDMVDKLIMIT